MQQIGTRTIIWTVSPNSSLSEHSATSPAPHVGHSSSLVQASITNEDGQIELTVSKLYSSVASDLS